MIVSPNCTRGEGALETPPPPQQLLPNSGGGGSLGVTAF